MKLLYILKNRINKMQAMQDINNDIIYKFYDVGMQSLLRTFI